MKNKKGFTIIELLVTIAVIAILVLLAVLGISNYIEKAQIARIQNDVRAVENVANAYHLEHGDYDTDGIIPIDDLREKASQGDFYTKKGKEETVDEDKTYEKLSSSITDEANSSLPGDFIIDDDGNAGYIDEGTGGELVNEEKYTDIWPGVFGGYYAQTLSGDTKIFDLSHEEMVPVIPGGGRDIMAEEEFMNSIGILTKGSQFEVLVSNGEVYEPQNFNPPYLAPKNIFTLNEDEIKNLSIDYKYGDFENPGSFHLSFFDKNNSIKKVDIKNGLKETLFEGKSFIQKISRDNKITAITESGTIESEENLELSSEFMDKYNGTLLQVKNSLSLNIFFLDENGTVIVKEPSKGFSYDNYGEQIISGYREIKGNHKSIAVSKDGTYFATLDENGEVTLYDSSEHSGEFNPREEIQYLSNFENERFNKIISVDGTTIVGLTKEGKIIELARRDLIMLVF